MTADNDMDIPDTPSNALEADAEETPVHSGETEVTNQAAAQVASEEIQAVKRAEERESRIHDWAYQDEEELEEAVTERRSHLLGLLRKKNAEIVSGILQQASEEFDTVRKKEKEDYGEESSADEAESDEETNAEEDAEDNTVQSSGSRDDLEPPASANLGDSDSDSDLDVVDAPAGFLGSRSGPLNLLQKSVKTSPVQSKQGRKALKQSLRSQASKMSAHWLSQAKRDRRFADQNFRNATDYIEYCKRIELERRATLAKELKAEERARQRVEEFRARMQIKGDVEDEDEDRDGDDGENASVAAASQHAVDELEDEMQKSSITASDGEPDGLEPTPATATVEMAESPGHEAEATDVETEKLARPNTAVATPESASLESEVHEMELEIQDTATSAAEGDVYEMQDTAISAVESDVYESELATQNTIVEAPESPARKSEAEETDPKAAEPDPKAAEPPSPTAQAPESDGPEIEQPHQDEEQDAQSTSDDASPSKGGNEGYRAILEAERKAARRMKRAKRLGIFDAEAEEESDDDNAKGLGDFGFGVSKRKSGDDSDDENERNADIATEEDLKHIVDEVSDNEGDDTLAEIARREDLANKEKQELGEVVRKMREGYGDGRSNRNSVRGAMRFEQLTAASKESREEAKRLGLHLSDEEESDNEESPKSKQLDIEELDEVQLADLLVKDMRNRVNGGRRNEEFDELFGDSDDEDVVEVDLDNKELDPEAAREAQEVAEERRWKKRARMRRALMHVRAREASRKQKGKVIDLDDESQEILSLLQCTNSNKSHLARQSSQSSSSSGGLSAIDLSHGGGMGMVARVRSVSTGVIDLASDASKAKTSSLPKKRASESVEDLTGGRYPESGSLQPPPLSSAPKRRRPGIPGMRPAPALHPNPSDLSGKKRLRGFPRPQPELLQRKGSFIGAKVSTSHSFSSNGQKATVAGAAFAFLHNDDATRSGFADENLDPNKSVVKVEGSHIRHRSKRVWANVKNRGIIKVD